MAWQARGFGYLRDRVRAAYEKPDRPASDLALPDPAALASVRKWVVGVLDQSAIGSCVSNAGAQGVRIVHRRKGIPLPPLLSRLYSYYAGRVIEGTEWEDAGLEIRDFFRVLKQWGFVQESQYPYDLSKWAEEPIDEVKRAALDQRAPAVYNKILEEGEAKLDQMRRALTAGYPVVFGVDVDAAFAMNEFDPLKNLPAPTSRVGGHCMLIEGYDQTGWIILNSWGEDFGDLGRCRFSDDYMLTATDCWILVDAPDYSEAA